MSGLSCCLPSISSKNVVYSNNLMFDKSIDCKEKLLFLYNFVEKQGYNLNLYPSVINNIKDICGNECCDLPNSQGTTTLGTDLKVSIHISCSDSIIAESYIIY